MQLKILIPFLLLLAVASGQLRSYDWRTSGRVQRWPKFSSLSSFEHQAGTESYPVKEDFKRYPEPSPIKEDLRYYPEPSPIKGDFMRYPEPSPIKEDFGRYPEPSSYLDSSFSSNFQNLPYVDQSISVSHDSYGEPPRKQLNMTSERIGGFAGSGDTRGYGAYDFPKNNHPDPLDHPEPEPYDEIPSRHPHMQRELTDLLKLNRNHRSRHPDPMLIYPLPPPL